MAKIPQYLYKERIGRINDAVQMKKPDRVPTIVDFGYYAAKYAGITVKDAFYDIEKWKMANRKIVTDFEPDVHHSLIYFSGAAYEALDTRLYKWPGHGLPVDVSQQYVEKENMKADEYDAFLSDPSDYMIRTYLPRTAGALAPLQYLPHLSSLASISSAMMHPTLINPDFVAACQAIYKAGQEAAKWFFMDRIPFVMEMEALGYPAIFQLAMFNTPFEQIAYNLRGMKGVMLDMFRQPDKLLAACNLLYEIGRKNAMVFPPMGGNNLAWTGVLRGADVFMSRKNFEKYYWPHFKENIIKVINSGFTPVIFWEGDCTSRLDYMLEFPEGKVIHRFDRTDIVRAKAILGGHSCIAGGILPSLLSTATVQQVKDRCKELIDTVGRDGGFIMSHACQMDDLKPENMKAMIDFTREYGVYK